jgi:hypothetical protein
MNSLRSAPAANACSLPVSTIARTEGSSCSPSNTAASALRVAMLSAFLASGRLIRTKATPSSGRSIRTNCVSVVTAHPPASLSLHRLDHCHLAPGPAKTAIAKAKEPAIPR